MPDSGRFRSNPVGHRADKSREQSPLVGSPSLGTVIPHEIQPGTSILTLRLVARDLLQFRDTAVVAQSSYYLQAVQAPLGRPVAAFNRLSVRSLRSIT